MTSSSALARKAKDGVDHFLWSCWQLGFSLASRFLSPRFLSLWERLGEGGGQRILVVAPHPDDEVVGCAGTILRHKAEGDQVYVLYVTDGRNSRAGGLGPPEMAGRRRDEALAVANLLDIDHVEWLGLPEGTWFAEDLAKPLQSLAEAYAPHVIYAPSRVDFHPEHHKVANALAHWLLLQGHMGPDPIIRIYQLQVPLTPILTNLVVPTGQVADRSLTAFRAYATQWDSIARTLRSRAYGASFYGFPRQVEEFWQLPACQYVRLHSSPCDQWPRSAFRSLRFRAASDPLAYLYGTAERRRLARLVATDLHHAS